MVDLIGFELSFEQTELHAANVAERAGDIKGAIGHIRSLASFLRVDLPSPPLPKDTAYDNYEQMRDYFFKCKILLGSQVGKRVDNIRASYGNPFTVTLKSDK